MAVPKYDELFQPLLTAMHQLGGSASVSEIDEEVAKVLNLSEEDVNDIHRGNATKLSYRLGWSRNYLKRFGLLESSARAVWRLTPKGLKTTKVDKEIVKKVVKEEEKLPHNEATNEIEEQELENKWQSELIKKIYSLSPKAFEQLCQRLLREAGFIQVEVTGRSGDGGIDGKGILRLNGFLSFTILFQCKRYQNSVPSKEIRDFRGAMQGRADKGLFITTSTFTRDAKQEATRDGVPPIDLIDGELLAEKMKDLDLGVLKKVEEVVEVDEDFFSSYI